MKGKKSEQIVLQKMIRYCNEIALILEKHHFNREDFDNDTVWESITEEIPELKEKLQLILHNGK